MKCEKIHGQLYCGYDNIIIDDKYNCRKPGIYGDVPDYFPQEPNFDNTIFICNNLKRDDINKKIFERKKCNQKLIPDYRPSFKVCNRYYNANNSRENPNEDLLTHPEIKQVPHCDGNVPVEEDSRSIKERRNISSNGFLEATIMITPKGNIHNKPLVTFRGLPVYENDDFIYGLEEEIERTVKTFSLNNIKQQDNLIDALKITCRKFSKEKTGKKPLTNINLVRI